MTMVHGGDLDEAMALARAAGFDAGARSDWLDLSTGINPIPYPVAAIPPSAFHRLPDKAGQTNLIQAACAYYKAPSPDHIVAAGGSALLIRLLPLVLPDRPVAVLTPTYGDHARVWDQSGRNLRALSDPVEARPSEITIIVNPNNPDGRVVSHSWLSAHAAKATQAGGFLVVDEAFGDVMDEPSAVDLVAGGNVIILKSLGKFFGLAGVRLGFAIAPPALAARLNDHLGAWAVSGPALHLGRLALEDLSFQAETKLHLQKQAARLAGLFEASGFSADKGTSLFRLIESDEAPHLFLRFLERQIYVRRFDYDPRWLRIGLPADEAGFLRLEQALCP